MMSLAEANLTDTSMCYPGLLPDPFSNRKTCNGKWADHFSCLIDPPSKLAVSKYDAFISVPASAGAAPTFIFLVFRLLSKKTAKC